MSCEDNFSLEKYPFSAYGVMGGFDGDEELEKDLLWCKKAYLIQSNTSDLGRLISILQALPQLGRDTLSRNILAKSPLREILLCELFDYCFQESENEDDPQEAVQVDDDFVWLATTTSHLSLLDDDNGDQTMTEVSTSTMEQPPRYMNLVKHQVFQTVLALIGVCGPAGARVSRKYLTSSSTRYRSQVLARCVTSIPPEDFSDDELWEAFYSSPDSVQDKVIDICKRSGHRQDFLCRVHKTMGSRYGEKLVFWLPTDFVSQHMEAVSTRLGFQRWEVHGDMYVEWIGRQLERHKKDQLFMGKLWELFAAKFTQTSGMQKRHVFQLMELLRTHRVCVYTKTFSFGTNVWNHLIEMSSSGADMASYQFVELASLEFSDLYKKVPKADLEERVRQAVKDGDWETFSATSRHVALQSLPNDMILKSASLEDLYMLLTNRMEVTREGMEQIRINPFFDHITASQDVLTEALRGDVNKISLKKALGVYHAWADLHLRYTPDKLSLEQRLDYFPGQSDRDIWVSWYSSHDRLLIAFGHAKNIMKEIKQGGGWRKPGFTRYVRYITELFKISLKGSQTVSGHVDIQTVLRPLKDFMWELFWWVDEEKDEASKALYAVLYRAAFETILPKLEALLVFDPSNEVSYIIDDSPIYFFSSTFSTIIARRRLGEELTNKCVELLFSIITRASANDGHVPLPNGEKRFVVVKHPHKQPSTKNNHFVFYNQPAHRNAIDTAVSCMVELLQREVVLEEKLQKRLWHEIVANTPTLPEYLQRCHCLGKQKNMMEEEKATIVERSREWLLSTIKRDPHGWKNQFDRLVPDLLKLGLLEEVLTDSSVTSETRESLLRQHGGFANEIFQTSLKGATFGSDGNSRAEGLIRWLDESIKSKSVPLMSRALAFAAARLKSESGLHRRTLFSWMETNIPDRVVRMSLRDKGQSTKALKSLCSLLETIMRNDLNSKDTVSRFCCFRNLPKLILENVLWFHPEYGDEKRREIWIHLAIRLSWTLEESMNGSEALQRYSWPLTAAYKTRPLPNSSWVEDSSLQAIEKQSKDMVIDSYGVSEIQDFVVEDVFGPKQCVAMLASALSSVWDKEEFLSDAVALRVTSVFPQGDEESSNALLERLNVLFSICGVAWQEADLLTEVFDAVFDGLEQKPIKHFHQAASLLGSIILIYEPAGYWFEVPRLSKACDKVFRFAVAASASVSKETINHWYLLWRQLYLDMGSRMWSHWSVPDDPRTLNFLLLHGRKNNSKKKKKLGRSMSELRRCLLARDALALSPSALELKDVQDILYSLRQDVLLRLIGGDKVDLTQGPLSFTNGSAESDGGVDGLLYETVNVESLAKFPAIISQRYARFALDKCTGSKSGIHERMEAMQNFVASPTTQHMDVLNALQQDGIEESIREALIGKIFTLDSPWHILAFLLSNSAIKKNDQKITASLLSNVAKHVHVDKVVGMLEILLRKREKCLVVQLHRAVIRMLFEHKTPRAVRLLRAEWEHHELHASVRTLLVEKCVDAVLTSTNVKEECEWETSVLRSVARDEKLPIELKMPLFGACAKDCSVVFKLPNAANSKDESMANAENSENDSALELFSQKMPKQQHAASDGAVDVFRNAMEELERHSTGTLRSFARFKKLSLSGLFASKPQSDRKALREMSDQLVTPVTTWNVVNELCIDFLSRLLVVGVARRLKEKIYQSPEAKKNAVTKDVCAEICEKCEEARELKDCVSRIIQEVLELPLRERVRRKQHLWSLDVIMEYSPRQFRRYAGLSEVLITDPFKSDLIMIREEAALIHGTSQRYNSLVKTSSPPALQMSPVSSGGRGRGAGRGGGRGRGRGGGKPSQRVGRIGFGRGRWQAPPGLGGPPPPLPPPPPTFF